MKQPIIKLEGITKIYHTDDIETHALSGIDLSLMDGDYVCLSGPSGCGKSTLLSILGLLDTPNSGNYFINGREVQNIKSSERAAIRNSEIGFIFQSFNLIGNLSVYENVELPLNYRNDMSRVEKKKQVESVLERVEMSHRSNHFPSQLSGGQQQRVAVARALVSKPSILLADEPTGNLDSKNGESVMQLLAELHKGGATICMVTHDSRFADYAQTTLQLLDGKIKNTLIQASVA